MFRHSQMFEVFITERLQMAADDYKTTDAFEAKVGLHWRLQRHGLTWGLLGGHSHGVPACISSGKTDLAGEGESIC